MGYSIREVTPSENSASPYLNIIVAYLKKKQQQQTMIIIKNKNKNKQQQIGRNEEPPRSASAIRNSSFQLCVEGYNLSVFPSDVVFICYRRASAFQ